MKAKKNIGRFEKSGIQVFTISMIANICSYLFQIVSGHLLSVEEFGTINALIAFMSIIVSPCTVLTSNTAKVLAEAKRDNRISEIPEIIGATIKITLALQFFFFIILLVLYPVFQNILQINNCRLILCAVIVAVVCVSTYASSGILQGLQKYIPYGIQSVIVNGGELVLSIVLISIDMSVYGVLVALLLSYLLSFVFSLRATGISIVECSWKEAIKYICAWKKYLLETAIIRTAILILLNMDTLLVKYLFSEYETGIFSSGIVIAKIGMYLATAIIVPLFPMVVHDGENVMAVKRLFIKAFTYGVGACIVYSLFINMFGKYVIKIMFGERYENCLHLLPYLCLYVIGITGLMIIMNYVLARDDISFFSVSVFLSILICVGIALSANSSVSVMFFRLSIILICTLALNIVHIFRKFRADIM